MIRDFQLVKSVAALLVALAFAFSSVAPAVAVLSGLSATVPDCADHAGHLPMPKAGHDMQASAHAGSELVFLHHEKSKQAPSPVEMPGSCKTCCVACMAILPGQFEPTSATVFQSPFGLEMQSFLAAAMEHSQTRPPIA